MLHKISTFFILMLIIALGITAYVLQTNLMVGLNSQTTTQSILSEAMQNVTAYRYDENGIKIQSITMRQWHQNLKDKQIYMENPNVLVENQDGSQWHIASIRGVGQQSNIKGQFDNITLLDKVNLIQRKDDDIQFKLNTEELNFKPQTKSALTDKPVQVTNDNMILSATGLKANLINKKITFLGKVRSTYEQTP